MKTKKINKSNKTIESKLRKLLVCKQVQDRFRLMKVSLGKENSLKLQKKKRNKNSIGWSKNFMSQMNKKKRKAQGRNQKNQFVKIKQSRLLPSTRNKYYHRHHLRNYHHLANPNRRKYMILNRNNLIIRNQKVEDNIESNKRKI